MQSSSSEDEDVKSEKSSDSEGEESGESSAGISESELDFLKRDAEQMEVEKGPSRRGNPLAKKKKTKRKAVIASDSESDEEPKKAIKKSPKKKKYVENHFTVI